MLFHPVKSLVVSRNLWLNLLPYFIRYIAHFFYIENDAEIFPAHYTWKVAEKGFRMNKLAMIHFCEIILEK
jgi:hypothetical protein